jgi:hypothetical protein
MADEFDFDVWSQDSHLNRKTCTLLHAQDLDTLASLSLAQHVDIMSLDLTAGQKRLVLAGIDAIQHVSEATQENQHSTAENAEVQEEPDVAHSGQANASLLDAGKTFDELLNEFPKQREPIKDTQFDPRMILTIRAQTRKAVHITQFINEKTKKRRASRRREIVLATQQGDSLDNLVIKTEDEHPYSGIHIDEWGAANSRLLNHLLVTGQLQRVDIEYYLAYTTQIFDYAGKYEWESVLDFDYTYRELQAEHNMVWGVFSSHLELHLLTPKRPPIPRPLQYRSAQQNISNIDCRMFKATGSCTFGDSCKYRHVRVFQHGSSAAPQRTEPMHQAGKWDARANVQKN